MNPNQPNPSTHGAFETNDAVLKKLHSYRWKGRVLAGAALGVGLFAILAAILIAWANSRMIMPMERLLLQDYPHGVSEAGFSPSNPTSTNAPTLRLAELDWRHVQVTFAHGKELFVTSVAIALLGVGTFLTLLLVIFNRHVTLRQINASLAQISTRIKELQEGKNSGPGQ